MNQTDLGNLGLGLLKGLSQLGGVKSHLFRASREVLLAVQGLMVLVDGYVAAMSSSDRQQVVRFFLTYAQKTVRTIVNGLPRGNEAEFREMHGKVMNSILEVIDMEIRKNSRRTASPKGKMKEEVLQAIRSVLTKEMGDDS